MTTAPTDPQTSDPQTPDPQTPVAQPTADDNAGLDVLFGRSRVIPPPLSPDPADAAATQPASSEPDAPPTYASVMGNLRR